MRKSAPAFSSLTSTSRELQSVRQVAEERLAVAERHRRDDELVLVDQVEPGQCLSRADAAVEDDVPAGKYLSALTACAMSSSFSTSRSSLSDQGSVSSLCEKTALCAPIAQAGVGDRAFGQVRVTSLCVEPVAEQLVGHETSEQERVGVADQVGHDRVLDPRILAGGADGAVPSRLRLCQVL